MAMNDEIISQVDIEEDSIISPVIKVNLDPNNHAYSKYKPIIITNADINASPTSTQKMSTWQCDKCTVENISNTQQCVACLATRPYRSDDDSDYDTYTMEPKTEEKHESIDNNNRIRRYHHHPKILSTKLSRPKVKYSNKSIQIHELQAIPTPVDAEQINSTYSEYQNKKHSKTLNVTDIDGDNNGLNVHDIIFDDDEFDGRISFEPGPNVHIYDDDDDDNDELEFFNHHPMRYSMYGGHDHFISNILNKLDLERYNDTFKEYNIDQKSLIYLDEAVVEFLIPDIKEQNNFIKWLKRYKRINGHDTIQFDLDELKFLEDNMKFAVFGFIRECEVMIPYYIPELIRWLILHYYHFIGIDDLNEDCLYWTDLKKKKQKKPVLRKRHYFGKRIKFALPTEKIKPNIFMSDKEENEDIQLFD